MSPNQMHACMHGRRSIRDSAPLEQTATQPEMNGANPNSIPNLMPRSTSAPDPPTSVAGSLELCSLTALPAPAQVPFSLCFLKLFLLSRTLSSLALPSPAAPLAFIPPVFAQPFAGDERRIVQVCPSLLFLLLRETEHPKP